MISKTLHTNCHDFMTIRDNHGCSKAQRSNTWDITLRRNVRGAQKKNCLI